MTGEDRGRRVRLSVPGDRGQLVLLAAAIVALALVPILMAYVQLGYHADVRATDGYTAPVEDAERTLERAVYDASNSVDGEYHWREREYAAGVTRRVLQPQLENLEESRIERGTVYRIEYNDSAAREYAFRECPGGDGQWFGSCQSDNGIVVQQRAQEAHLVAVAFDLTVTTERGETEVTVVVEVVGGVAR